MNQKVKPQIILLGNKTYSEKAYRRACDIYKIPRIRDSVVVRVNNNSQILPALKKSPGAYACIAISTSSGGIIIPNVDSFLEQTPFDLKVIGSLRERILLSIHRHSKTHPSEIVGTICHDRAWFACRKSIKDLGIQRQVDTGSNEEAILEVANNIEYKNWAAIGPVECATENGLVTMVKDFGDSETFTSFLIMRNGSNDISKKSEQNKCWVFFNLTNVTGSLVNFLNLINPINITYIHSKQQKPDSYRFSIELSIHRYQLPLFNSKINAIKNAGTNVWVVGPYQCV